MHSIPFSQTRLPTLLDILQVYICYTGGVDRASMYSYCFTQISLIVGLFDEESHSLLTRK